jgi:hypothetical protein
MVVVLKKVTKNCINATKQMHCNCYGELLFDAPTPRYDSFRVLDLTYGCEMSEMSEPSELRVSQSL